eukprot:COSAG02_NODE_1733_length_11168_cov_29.568705_5_plen_99_part_00
MRSRRPAHGAAHRAREPPTIGPNEEECPGPRRCPLVVAGGSQIAIRARREPACLVMAAAADRPSHLRFEFESPAVRNSLSILVIIRTGRRQDSGRRWS